MLISTLTDAADWAVANRNDLLGPHEPAEFSLATDGVQLYFVCYRLDAGVAEQVCYHLQVEVGHTDRTNEPLIMKSLELRIEDMNRHSIRSIRLPKTGWPMDKVQVNVLYLKLLKGKAKGCGRIIEVIHPEFSHDKELIACHMAFRNSTLHSLSHDLFILIVSCAVEQPISTIDDRFVDHLRICQVNRAKS